MRQSPLHVKNNQFCWPNIGLYNNIWGLFRHPEQTMCASLDVQDWWGVSISISPLDAENRKDAVTRRKRVDFIVFRTVPSSNHTTTDHFVVVDLFSFRYLPCSHRVVLNQRTAALRGAPSQSCCSGSLWFIRSTPCGCCTAFSTPNPAMEAEESTASPLTWQQDPDYRLVQARASSPSYSSEQTDKSGKP